MVNSGDTITAALLNSLPVPLALLSTGSVTNLNTEQTIGTFSGAYPANDASVNSCYQLLIFGTWDCTSTPTIRYRAYIDTTSGGKIFDSTARTASGTATSQPYLIEAWFCVTSTGSSGTFEAGGYANIGNASGQPCGSNFTAQAIDTTSSHSIILTAQYSAASSSNTARTLGGTMGRRA